MKSTRNYIEYSKKMKKIISNLVVYDEVKSLELLNEFDERMDEKDIEKIFILSLPKGRENVLKVVMDKYEMPVTGNILYWAAHGNKPKIAKEVIKGIKQDLKNKDPNNDYKLWVVESIYAAAKHGDEKLIEILLAEIDIDDETRENDPALYNIYTSRIKETGHYIVQHDKIKMMRKLLPHIKNHSISDVIIDVMASAIRQNKRDMADLLFEHCDMDKIENEMKGWNMGEKNKTWQWFLAKINAKQQKREMIEAVGKSKVGAGVQKKI